MRYLIILLSFLMFSFWCDKPAVKLVDATSEVWVGGVKGSGMGTNYKITIIVQKNSDVLSFDSLWVGERPLAVQVSRPHPFQTSDGFGKNDTVIVYASIHRKADPDGDLQPLPLVEGSLPVDYEGDALLRYYVRKKAHYLTIESIRELPRLDYP